MAYQHVNTKPEFSCILFAENKGRREGLSAFKKADIFQQGFLMTAFRTV